MENLDWKRRRLIRRYYASYPVLIKNNSNRLFNIGYGLNVNIVAEALDMDSLWKPIEGHFTYDCGTGLTDLYLMPDEVACILFPKYSGSYKTKIRLKLKGNISEEFNATINPSQFISIISN